MDLPLPPRKLRFMGEDDTKFALIGDGIVTDLRDLCALDAESTVVDIGSGYGRVAHALNRTDYRGRYLGLEILPLHVAWCAENITPASEGRYAFGHLDVRNDRYHPAGTMAADEVTMPVDDASVDIAVLTSVFTHMYPADIARYISELHRILRPGGRALTTFFALDDSWVDTEGTGLGLSMPHELSDDIRYHNADDPLHAIGYRPSWIRRTVADAGLRIFATRLGGWCGRPAGMGYQDTFVLERPGG